MGTYIESNLIKDEKVLHNAKNSCWPILHRAGLVLVFFTWIIFFAGPSDSTTHGASFSLITKVIPMIVAFITIAPLVCLPLIISYFTTELAITNKRVVAKFGLIRRGTIEMNISKVESVQVDQGVIGRIFNYGNIFVSGAGNPKAPIPSISNPLEFRKKFFEIQESESGNS